MGFFSWLFGSSSSGGGTGGRELQAQKMALFEKAREQAEAGEDFHDTLRKSNRKALLKHAESSVVVGVEVEGDCCEACSKAVGGEKLGIEEALREEILPYHGCTREGDEFEEGWCVCWYATIVDDEF
jgi:Fe-S cluster biogenesis protein NfuA